MSSAFLVVLILLVTFSQHRVAAQDSNVPASDTTVSSLTFTGEQTFDVQFQNVKITDTLTFNLMSLYMNSNPLNEPCNIALTNVMLDQGARLLIYGAVGTDEENAMAAVMPTVVSSFKIQNLVANGAIVSVIGTLPPQWRIVFDGGLFQADARIPFSNYPTLKSPIEGLNPQFYFVDVKIQDQTTFNLYNIMFTQPRHWDASPLVHVLFRGTTVVKNNGVLNFDGLTFVNGYQHPDDLLSPVCLALSLDTDGDAGGLYVTNSGLVVLTNSMFYGCSLYAKHLQVDNSFFVLDQTRFENTKQSVMLQNGYTGDAETTSRFRNNAWVLFSHLSNTFRPDNLTAPIDIGATFTTDGWTLESKLFFFDVIVETDSILTFSTITAMGGLGVTSVTGDASSSKLRGHCVLTQPTFHHWDPTEEPFTSTYGVDLAVEYQLCEGVYFTDGQHDVTRTTGPATCSGSATFTCNSGYSTGATEVSIESNLNSGSQVLGPSGKCQCSCDGGYGPHCVPVSYTQRTTTQFTFHARETIPVIAPILLGWGYRTVNQEQALLASSDDSVVIGVDVEDMRMFSFYNGETLRVQVILGTVRLYTASMLRIRGHPFYEERSGDAHEKRIFGLVPRGIFPPNEIPVMKGHSMENYFVFFSVLDLELVRGVVVVTGSFDPLTAIMVRHQADLLLPTKTYLPDPCRALDITDPFETSAVTSFYQFCHVWLQDRSLLAFRNINFEDSSDEPIPIFQIVGSWKVYHLSQVVFDTVNTIGTLVDVSAPIVIQNSLLNVIGVRADEKVFRFAAGAVVEDESMWSMSQCRSPVLLSLESESEAFVLNSDSDLVMIFNFVRNSPVTGYNLHLEGGTFTWKGEEPAPPGNEEETLPESTEPIFAVESLQMQPGGIRIRLQCANSRPLSLSEIQLEVIQLLEVREVVPCNLFDNYCAAATCPSMFMASSVQLGNASGIFCSCDCPSRSGYFPYNRCLPVDSASPYWPLVVPDKLLSVRITDTTFSGKNHYDSSITTRELVFQNVEFRQESLTMFFLSELLKNARTLVSASELEDPARRLVPILTISFRNCKIMGGVVHFFGSADSLETLEILANTTIFSEVASNRKRTLDILWEGGTIYTDGMILLSRFMPPRSRIRFRNINADDVSYPEATRAVLNLEQLVDYSSSSTVPLEQRVKFSAEYLSAASHFIASSFLCLSNVTLHTSTLFEVLNVNFTMKGVWAGESQTVHTRMPLLVCGDFFIIQYGSVFRLENSTFESLNPSSIPSVGFFASQWHVDTLSDVSLLDSTFYGPIGLVEDTIADRSQSITRVLRVSYLSSFNVHGLHSPLGNLFDARPFGNFGFPASELSSFERPCDYFMSFEFQLQSNIRFSNLTTESSSAVFGGLCSSYQSIVSQMYVSRCAMSITNVRTLYFFLTGVGMGGSSIHTRCNLQFSGLDLFPADYEGGSWGIQSFLIVDHPCGVCDVNIDCNFPHAARIENSTGACDACLCLKNITLMDSLIPLQHPSSSSLPDASRCHFQPLSSWRLLSDVTHVSLATPHVFTPAEYVNASNDLRQFAVFELEIDGSDTDLSLGTYELKCNTEVFNSLDFASALGSGCDVEQFKWQNDPLRISRASRIKIPFESCDVALSVGEFGRFYNDSTAKLSLPPHYGPDYFYFYLDFSIDSTVLRAEFNYTMDLGSEIDVGYILPTITDMSGCAFDTDDVESYQSVFVPPAMACALQNPFAVTITGTRFTTNMQMYFLPNRKPPARAEMTRALPSDAIPCLELQFMSSTKVVCHRFTLPDVIPYPTLFVALYRWDYLIVNPVNTLIYITGDNRLFCEEDEEGNLCSGHGYCDPADGQCVCQRSPATGFWGGSACGECFEPFNGSETSSCLVPCPISDEGSICGGGDGWCQNGQCNCGGTWVTGACNGACAGSEGVPCSGAGTCNRVTSECECYNDDEQGHFDGPICQFCLDGYSGEECLTECPKHNGLTCNGHGACVRGACFCEGDFCGPFCNVTVPANAALVATVCSACAAPSEFGYDCSFWCPGTYSEGDLPCNGHGVCHNGTLGLGICKCEEGYGSADCSAVCPFDWVNQQYCSGHGRCLSATGTCACDLGFGTEDCSKECPMIEGKYCGRHGMCEDSSFGSGTCNCFVGFYGTFCNESCTLRNDTVPCSGHGTCSTETGYCECTASEVLGHWSGDTCNKCAYGYGPANSCLRSCPANSEGHFCSNHGDCNGEDLTCQCHRNETYGFWTGPNCDQCHFGYAGESCDWECDGGACEPCNFRGTCAREDGTCTCFADTTNGFWDSADGCTSCLPGYYGTLCQNKCPDTCGFGKCKDGRSGDGTCLCDPRFRRDPAQPANPACTTCLAANFGPACRGTCASCSSHGTCSNGLQGTGLCRCEDGWTGSLCSLRCNRTSDGRFCGNGTCVTGNLCICVNSNFRVSPIDGTCSLCLSGYYGPNCNIRCPTCARGDGSCDRLTGACNCPLGYWDSRCSTVCPGPKEAPCSLHGTCSSTNGTCLCDRSPTKGYWNGTSCQSCHSHYRSENCSVPCPIGPNGLPCSGRGTCFNGKCYFCAPTASETHLRVVCGAACNVEDRSCFGLSAVSACPPGYWGPPSCSSLCPGATTESTTGVCNAAGICNDLNGTCFCVEGFSGPNCSTSSCPMSQVGNVLRPCGGRGSCNERGVCNCTSGYAGAACQLTCPGGAANPCSGRGTCSPVTGLCTCAFGTFRSDCSGVCPGGKDTPCNHRGVCDSSGGCTCYFNQSAGFYSGYSCESCAPSYYGLLCNIECPVSRGVILDGTCHCSISYTGASCEIPCPRSTENNLVCSGHGTCLPPTSSASSASAIGVCLCDDTFYGTLCDTFCEPSACFDSFEMLNAQCNVDTGACECQADEYGHYSGEYCDECAVGWWGAECAYACGCSGHGSCDRDTSLCTCFADPYNGYWMEPLCSTCVEGYVGSYCRSPNIRLSVRRESGVINDNASSISNLFVVDDSYGIRSVCTLLSTTYGVYWMFSGSSKLEARDLDSLRLIRTVPLTDIMETLREERIQEATALSCELWNETYFIVQVVVDNYLRPYSLFVPLDPLSVDDPVPASLSDVPTGAAQERQQGTVQSSARQAVLPSVLDDSTRSESIATAVHTEGSISISCATYYTILVFEDGSFEYGPDTLLEDSADVMLVVRCVTIDQSTQTSTTHIAVVMESTSFDVVVTWMSVHLSSTGTIRCVISAVSEGYDEPSEPTLVQDGKYEVQSLGYGPYAIVADIQNEQVTVAVNTNLQTCTVRKQATIGGVSYVVCGAFAYTLDGTFGYYDVQVVLVNIDALRFGFGAGGISNRVVQGSYNSEYFINAIDLDLTSSRFCLMAAGLPGITSQLFTFQLPEQVVSSLDVFGEALTDGSAITSVEEQFSLIGTQDLAGRMVVALDVNEVNRTVTCTVLRVQELSTLVLNLFGVYEVSPTVVDAAGGAVVTIFGHGFPTNSSVNVTCQTSSSITIGEVVNSSAVLCRIGPTAATNSFCTVEAIMVLFDVNQSTVPGAVVLRRPVSALIASVTSASRDTVGYSSAATRTTLQISGFGFVATPFATCRVVLRDDPSYVFFTSSATIRSSTQATCTQPPTNASFLPTCLQYSHDGFTYGVSCSPLTLVGDFSQIELELPQDPKYPGFLVAYAAKTVTIPSFYIFSTDPFHNRRLKYENINGLTIRCSTLEPNVAITNQVAEELPFSEATAYTMLRVPMIEGVSTFSLTLTSPKRGVYSMYCFRIDDSLAALNFSIMIQTGVPETIYIEQSPLWVIGVRSRVPLKPNPVAWLRDSAGNTISDSRQLPDTMTVVYDILDVDEANFVRTQVTSGVSSDGSYSFDNVVTRSVFGYITTLSFVAIHVRTFVLQLPFEKCVQGSEYAVPGTTKCAKCPASGICDGSSAVTVLPGHWRASLDAYSFYQCSPAESCTSAMTCAQGYEGRICKQCADGYGHSATLCTKCYSRAINAVVITAMLIVVIALIWYLSIHAMPITAKVDTFYDVETNVEDKLNPISLTIKIILSHVQIFSMVPLTEIPVPDWFATLTATTKSGSSLSPNVAFVACELGDGVQNQVKILLALLGILFCVFVVIALAAAYMVSDRFRDALFQTVVIQKGAVDQSNEKRVAEFVARGDPEYFQQVVKSHKEFLGFDEQEMDDKFDGRQSIRSAREVAGVMCVQAGASVSQFPESEASVAGANPLTSVGQRSLEPNEMITALTYASDQENLLLGLQQVRESVNASTKTLLKRWGNMLASSVIVTVFLIYPTVVESAAAVLQCTSIDLGNGHVASVVRAEPSLRCDTKEYDALRLFGWTVVILFGLGAPVMIFLIIWAMRRLTCNNSVSIAYQVFFFATGGYAPEYAFWECISLTRKAALVLGIALFTDIQLKLLWAIWILFLSVLVNIVVRPWAIRSLSILEIASFSVLACTFTFFYLIVLNQNAIVASHPTYVPPPGQEESRGHLGYRFADVMIGLALAFNLAIVLNFAISIGRFVRLTLAKWIHTGHPLILKIVGLGEDKNAELRNEIGQVVKTMRRTHRRVYEFARMEALLITITSLLIRIEQRASGNGAEDDDDEEKNEILPTFEEVFAPRRHPAVVKAEESLSLLPSAKGGKAVGLPADNDPAGQRPPRTQRSGRRPTELDGDLYEFLDTLTTKRRIVHGNILTSTHVLQQRYHNLLVGNLFTTMSARREVYGDAPENFGVRSFMAAADQGKQRRQSFVDAPPPPSGPLEQTLPMPSNNSISAPPVRFLPTSANTSNETGGTAAAAAAAASSGIAGPIDGMHSLSLSSNSAAGHPAQSPARAKPQPNQVLSPVAHYSVEVEDVDESLAVRSDGGLPSRKQSFFSDHGEMPKVLSPPPVPTPSHRNSGHPPSPFPSGLGVSSIDIVPATAQATPAAGPPIVPPLALHTATSQKSLGSNGTPRQLSQRHSSRSQPSPKPQWRPTGVSLKTSSVEVLQKMRSVSNANSAVGLLSGRASNTSHVTVRASAPGDNSSLADTQRSQSDAPQLSARRKQRSAEIRNLRQLLDNTLSQAVEMWAYWVELFGVQPVSLSQLPAAPSPRPPPLPPSPPTGNRDGPLPGAADISRSHSSQSNTNKNQLDDEPQNSNVLSQTYQSYHGVAVAADGSVCDEEDLGDLVNRRMEEMFSAEKAMMELTLQIIRRLAHQSDIFEDATLAIQNKRRQQEMEAQRVAEKAALAAAEAQAALESSNRVAPSKTVQKPKWK